MVLFTRGMANIIFFSLQGNLTNENVLIGLARKAAGVSAGFETNRNVSENLFRIREEKNVPCGFGVSLLS